MGLNILSTYYDSQKSTRIIYKCAVCGYEGNMKKSHFKDGHGCPVCSGKKTLRGFNDIATTDPNIAKYIIPKEDAYKYTRGSGKKVSLQCDICGTVFSKTVAMLVRDGFRCPICYTGISYPNRFMASLLSHFNIKYTREQMFVWSKKYRYDFYLPDHNLIIEMNGKQHYENRVGWECPEIINERDSDKLSLAKRNGISHYFVIPLKKTDAQTLETSIIKSHILNVLNITPNDNDWMKIIDKASVGAAGECLKHWNKGERSISSIAQLVGVDVGSASFYLRKYAELGLCNYSIKKHREWCRQKAILARSRQIMCIETRQVFDSIQKAGEYAGVSGNSIQNCLAGRTKTSGKDKNNNKLHWKYL